MLIALIGRCREAPFRGVLGEVRAFIVACSTGEQGETPIIHEVDQAESRLFISGEEGAEPDGWGCGYRSRDRSVCPCRGAPLTPPSDSLHPPPEVRRRTDLCLPTPPRTWVACPPIGQEPGVRQPERGNSDENDPSAAVPAGSARATRLYLRTRTPGVGSSPTAPRCSRHPESPSSTSTHSRTTSILTIRCSTAAALTKARAESPASCSRASRAARAASVAAFAELSRSQQNGNRVQ